MRTLWVLLLVLPAFAGCLGGGEDDHDHDSHDHGEDLHEEHIDVEPVLTLTVRPDANITVINATEGGSNETADGNATDGNQTVDGNETAPQGNETAPQGNETNDGNQTVDGNETVDGNATEEPAEPAWPTVLVTVPMNVTFDITFDDPQKDDLNWTLDVDGDGIPDTEGLAIADNGTYLPFNFTFTYGEAGNYSVRLIATDGENAAEAGLDVVASEPVEEPPEVPVEEEEEGDGLCHALPAQYTTLPPAGPEVFYVADGTWLYEETNGVPGLQWDERASMLGEVHAKGVGCSGGDTVIF